MKNDPLKFSFEYPLPVFVHKGEHEWMEMTMLDISFKTTLHYFKSHSSGYETFVLTILGFGFRLERQSDI